MKIAVIGGGICGLTTSALAAQQGHEVVHLEARPQWGGVAGALTLGGHRFSPGPQYVWGFGPGGPAWSILGAAGAQVQARVFGEDFEQVAFGQRPFEAVLHQRPAQLRELPTEERAGALRFADALDAIGRAADTLSDDATFRRSGRAMIAAVIGAPVSAADKLWVARARNLSVAALGRRLGASPRAIRLLTHAQGIFAERLEALSAVLFAAARHHLRGSPAMVAGGYPALIDALHDAGRRAGVQQATRTPVIAAQRTDRGTRLILGGQGAGRLDVDAVVWAISPGALLQLLDRTARHLSGPAPDTTAARLRRDFQAGHTVSSACLLLQLDDRAQRALAGRNFTWFANDTDDVAFDSAPRLAPASMGSPPWPLKSGPLESGPLEAGPLESGPLESGRGPPVPTVNFTSPTLNDRTPGTSQVLCTFGPGGSSTGALVDQTRALLGRLGGSVQVQEVRALPPQAWTQELGAFEGAVYGRRVNARSLQRSLVDAMPAGWHLAHSGAGIPGILGCLQLAQATARALGRPAASRPAVEVAA